MFDWAPLYTTSWKNPKIRVLSPFAKGVFRYLCSNPSTTRSGIYCLSIDETAFDLSGVDLVVQKDAVLSALDEIAVAHITAKRKTPLIEWDPGTGVVWVVGQWKQSVSKSPRHIMGLGNEFLRMSSLPFWAEFWAKYKNDLAFLKSPKSYKQSEDIKTLTEGLKLRSNKVLKGAGITVVGEKSEGRGLTRIPPPVSAVTDDPIKDNQDLKVRPTPKTYPLGLQDIQSREEKKGGFPPRTPRPPLETFLDESPPALKGDGVHGIPNRKDFVDATFVGEPENPGDRPPRSDKSPPMESRSEPVPRTFDEAIAENGLPLNNDPTRPEHIVDPDPDRVVAFLNPADDLETPVGFSGQKDFRRYLTKILSAKIDGRIDEDQFDEYLETAKGRSPNDSEETE